MRLLLSSTVGSLSYQRIKVVANQGSIVDNISSEHDKEEEESKHHITKITEDVVECTV